MEELVNKASGMVWSLGLVAFALGAGLFFSIMTRFVQFRYFKEMIKLLFEKGNPESGVSSFQAFSMALAGRVGIGNIAGVATAIAFGGPGAVFWMWIMALLGGASSFIESTLAQIYKVKDGNQYRGGTPYFIEKGLNMKWFAVFVAIVVTLCYGILVPGIQANTIAVGFENTIGLNKSITGIILVVLLGIIIFGGVKRIANVAEKVVPFMALGYVVITFVLLFANAAEIPAMLWLIISSAFGANEMFGGIIGAAIAWGVKRAVFSNVAGVGEGTYSSAAADVSHPAKQGLVQAFSVYIDTLIVCTATALMILITGMYSVTPEGKQPIVENIQGVEAGPMWTQAAVESVIPGFGGLFVAIAIFFFAFTTLMAYYYISETTLVYLGRKRRLKGLKAGLMIVFLGMIYLGSVENASLLWALGDFGFGSMAWLNLVAILFLTKTALKVFKDYEEQRKAGIEPVFDPVKLGIKGADFWEEKAKERNSKGKKAI
ncbi:MULTISPECIES: alanine/glycine:cation symporter family protein [Bacillaceae]|uniref:Alanine:cation symporter family protein n=1 Tax=Cytobacillus firmus TaxID=1399 RepID=A0AA46PAF8_CYTFI|nr:MULTISPECIES: alanine/glycine:cation symporter family protein [Bacillaceae]KML45248.1 sodium:alanine symporter [Cytobacillus firmus]MBG9444529.1 sodium:alanine symporter [Cytobacillus firmus]MCC3648671.1 alanine:cation symporter family protein [Cytobacillus oceanisediminis]MCS0656000.1 alanine:cation symporter family protein [Cytobacillus firmus]MCU1806948.1 alanine:cation symporter family protein [Cytobacillus firmus]